MKNLSMELVRLIKKNLVPIITNTGLMCIFFKYRELLIVNIVVWVLFIVAVCLIIRRNYSIISYVYYKSLIQDKKLLKATIRVKLKEVERLLEEGADVNTSDANGWIPLHWAVCSGSLDMVRLLLHYNTTLTAKTNKGSTPLDMAEENGDKEMIKLLTKHKL